MADQNVAIPRRHLIDRVSVADLCDEHRAQPSMFSKSQDWFFEKGAAAIQRQTADPQAPQKEIFRLEEKLRRKNEDIAEPLEQQHS